MSRLNFYSRILVIMLLLIASETTLAAGPPIITIEIRDHLFFPDVIRVPAATKVKLLVKNTDATAEEFESYQLNREKVIAAHSQAIIFIGPLLPGEYPFFGEFFPKTAQGKVIVEK